VPLTRDRFEGGIDFAPGSGVHDLDLHPHRARSRFELSQRELVLGSRSWIALLPPWQPKPHRPGRLTHPNFLHHLHALP
jgi:hypothetical protein